MFQWDLICDRGHLPYTITTIQMVGTLIGACIAGQLADTFGRRRVLYSVYLLLLAVGFFSSFSSSWQMFTVFRFFVGAFFGGTCWCVELQEVRELTAPSCYIN